MNCVETQKRIDAFLDDRMSYRETEEFLEHVEHCKSCYDELEVRTMVRYTQVALERDDSMSYNLKELLPKKIEAKHRWIRKKKITYLGLFAGAILLIAAIVVFSLLFPDGVRSMADLMGH